MKKIIILMVCLWGLGNTFTSAQTTEKEKFISSLMKQMTLDEKIGQLAQCTYRGNFTGPDYNPQIQISVVSGTKRSIFRQKNKTKRSKKRLHTTLIKPEQKVNEDLCSGFIVS